MWHVRETGNVYAGSWLGDRREIDDLEDPGIDEMIILK